MMTYKKLEYFDFLRNKFIADRETNAFGAVVQIQIGCEVFHCHRYILAANSGYFAALFKSDFSEVKKDTLYLSTEHVDVNIFPKLIDAMYGEELKIEANNVILIFCASLYLQLDYFVGCCKNYILENIEILDAIELIMCPQMKFDSSLYTFVRKFISQNFCKLASRLVQLPLEILEELIPDSELVVPIKEFFINFCRSWIAYDPKERLLHLTEDSKVMTSLHEPLNQSRKFASILRSYYDNNVVVGFNLSESQNYGKECKILRNIQNYPGKCEFHVQELLFFAQPNKLNNCDILLATYNNEIWSFFDQPRLPVTFESWTKYEGAVVNDVLYVSAESRSMNNKTVFCSFNAEKQEWVELVAPGKMPECFVTCNSMLYSYEDSVNEDQFSFFEPVANCWFKLPPVKYPCQKAGVVSDGSVLYKLGGTLPLIGSCEMNVIEMYDRRCASWSIINVENTLKIKHLPYSKRVSCLDNFLYLFVPIPDYNISCFDIRNNKWPYYSRNSVTADNPDGYAITVNKEIWFVLSKTNEIRKFSSSCGFIKEIYNMNVLKVQPIALQSRAQA